MHDKIYAFLGMASDCLDGGFVVDYDATITDVYYNTVIFYHRLKTAIVEDRIEMIHLASLLRHALGQQCISWRVEVMTPFKVVSLMEEWRKYENASRTVYERHYSESEKGKH